METGCCAQPDVFTVTSCTARNLLNRANRQRTRLCNRLTSLIPHRSHQEFFCNPHLLLTTDLSQIYQGYIRQYDTPRTKATYLYATWFFQISHRLKPDVVFRQWIRSDAQKSAHFPGPGPKSSPSQSHHQSRFWKKSADEIDDWYPNNISAKFSSNSIVTRGAYR